MRVRRSHSAPRFGWARGLRAQSRAEAVTVETVSNCCAKRVLRSKVLPHGTPPSGPAVRSRHLSPVPPSLCPPQSRGRAPPAPCLEGRVPHPRPRAAPASLLSPAPVADIRDLLLPCVSFSAFLIYWKVGPEQAGLSVGVGGGCCVLGTESRAWLRGAPDWHLANERARVGEPSRNPHGR